MWVDENNYVWRTVINLAKELQPGSWLLVGGAMSHIYASIADVEPRTTADVDMLIDLYHHDKGLREAITHLNSMGFEANPPAIRGTAFHRVQRDNDRGKKDTVDILVADHLPSIKHRYAHVNAWPVMEAPGGSRAIENRMQVTLETTSNSVTIEVPDAYGALMLKSDAWQNDSRDRERHLYDVAVIACAINNPYLWRNAAKGHDLQRINRIIDKLSDITNINIWGSIPYSRRAMAMKRLKTLRDVIDNTIKTHNNMPQQVKLKEIVKDLDDEIARESTTHQHLDRDQR